MVFAFQPLNDFVKQAKKGIRYGEDFFACYYTYSQESQNPEALIGSFMNHLLTMEEDKRPYVKWLQNKKYYDMLKTQVTMPGFFDRMKPLTKDEFYKRMVFHVPASDLMDLMSVQPDSSIYYYKFPTTTGMIPGDEAGNILYLILNKENIGVVHSVFN